MAKTREQLEAELKGWQTVYNSAKKRGNKKAMENAHEAANKIREEMGTAKTSEQSQAELNGWGYVYNAAKRRGDTEGMAEAHRQANKIRAEQGWEYDEGSGKTYDRIFGPIKRTVNSKTVMQNAKIWNPKDVELYYKPEHYTTFTTTPTRRTLTTPASSYLRGSLNTPSLPSAAARQNDPVYSAALDLTTGKYESTDAQDFAKSLAYGTEKTLAGAAGAVEDALRFASGYGNKLLSGITSLGGLADNPLSDSLAQTAENTLSGSYVDRWRQSIDERYQPTEFQQKLGELNEAAGAMLPSIAASIATGGLSNAAAIGKGASMTAAGARAAQDISRGIGLATMFPQVAGSSTRQAIQEGANVDSALAYGALSGGLETATESLFAGIPGIAGGRVSQALQNIIAKATKSPAVSKVADILGEGVEEVISGYVTPYLQRLTYNEQAELASNDELLENFISGVALSGIMQGGSGIAGRIANRSAGQGIDVNSLGENSRKNYIAQMERDGGTTRGFEKQWKQYNDAGNAGIPFDQVNADTTGIGMSRAYAAHAAGMNDYNARQAAQATVTQKTSKSAEPKETVVSLSTVDESGIPETTFSDSSARALSKIQDIAKRTGRSEQEVAKSLLQTYENQYQNAINAATEYIKGYQPQGVSVVGRDSTTGQGGYRVSNNEKWYSDFYQKNGRKPNSSDIPALAEQLVKEDRSGTMFGFSADSMNTLEDYREIVNNVLNRKGFSRIEKTDDGYQAVYNEPQSKETTTPTTYTPGLVQNDYTESVSESTAKSIDSIAKKVGVSVEITDNVSTSGEYRDGVIRINANSDNPVQQIFVHELTHHLEQSKGYSDLVSVIEKNLRTDGIDTQSLKDQIKSEYSERGVELDDDGANRELVAKYAESYLFTDESSIQRLANQNRSLAQRIKDWIHGMVVKFKGTRQEKALLEAEKKYIKALKNTTGARETGKTQYSISGSDYGLFKTNDPKIDSEKENLSYQDASILLDNQIGLYYRSSEKTDGMSDFGHAMFVDKNGLENLSSYRGEQIFSVSENDLYDINDLKDSILSARNKTQEESFDLDDFADLSDEEFFAMFNPSDIVDSAGAYDNDVLISWLYDNVLEPNGITGVKTDDGAVVYDPEIIYRNIPAEKYMYSSPEYSTGSSFDKLLRDAGYTQEADALLRASNRYGTIERGEMPARDVQLPTQMDDTTRVRRFARTAAESSILTDEQAGEIGKAVAEGRFNYEPIPNNAARAHAEDILSRGEQYAQDAWDRVVNNTRPASKNDIAVGEYLLKQAAEAGDTQRVVELTAQIAAEGTRAGQIVQAMSMLKRLDGVGQSIALDAMLKKMQGDLDRGKSGVFLKVPDNLRDELVKAKGQDQIDKAMDKIYDNLAQQMPRKWSDKWNAWRYLSMLGNPRTHIRNVAGNAMFAPVVGVKNAVGAIIESGVYNAQKIAGKEGIERTKTIRGTIPLTGGKARSFAIDDFSKVQDIIKGGGKMNPSDIVREKQAVFKFKPLESLRKLNFNALEAEDGIFLKQHYVRSMVQYFQANKINLDSFNPDGNQKDAVTLQKARDYAIKEAQKATYRDFSRVAQAISNASRNAGSAASILIEGVLPFKKTPINVLKRGIEYSPAGLLQAMTIGTNQLRKGEISANEFIDRLSAGMTGTAISYLGMLLFKSGLLVGGPGDDKEAEFRDSLGAQSYAIKLGDTTYTIDWLAPASMPLFVGAEIQNLADTFDGIDGRVVYDSILNLAEPMTKMSMLDGLNTSISSVRYGDDPLSDMATNAVISYIGQAVPTLFGQISRTLDDTARTTYIEKNGGLPDSVQRALQKNRNKLPGLSQQSIAYRDVFGRAEKDTSMLSRALKNFISPGYFSEEKIGSMESELIRVYQDTGDSGALPSMPAKYFNVNGERKDLTAEEYEKFSYTRGSLMYSNLSELTGSDSYKNLDDTDKASVISDIIDLSNALAKTEVSDYQLDGWMAYAKGAVDAGIKIPDFVLIRSQTSGLSGYKDENGETVTNSSSVRKAYYLLTETSLTPSQRSYMYDVLNVGKKVREMSPEKVKSEYQKMYNEYGR